MNSFGCAVWSLTAVCMLSVCPASRLVLRLSTESRLCVLTSKRTGPFGEAPVLGTNAKLPLMPMLLSWFGYAPVVNLKSAGTGLAGGAIRASASPAALKPVSAIGFSAMTEVTVSVAVDRTLTRPTLASS